MIQEKLPEKEIKNPNWSSLNGGKLRFPPSVTVNESPLELHLSAEPEPGLSLCSCLLLEQISTLNKELNKQITAFACVFIRKKNK